MSDALTDINRDNRMNSLCYKITFLWLADMDYTEEMEELKNMRRGYFNPQGIGIAEHMEKLFSECDRDKFEYISPNFMDGQYSPEELRVDVEKFKLREKEESQ